MDKLLFKKALSFVDALRVRFGNMLSTALVYVVYAMAVDQSKNPTDWAQWWDDFDEAKYRYLGTYLEMCQNWVDAKAEEAVAVVSETLAYFDERFATGHHNTEVYLGRDGVYPYLARRAQLWVRRQRGIQVPRVVYLVFNSEHRSLLPKDVAVEYLAQFGLTADTIKDCVFYDTGYSGSIPVKILTLLGVDSVLHNDHIRLTCYVSDPNHVRNIPLVETRKFLKNYGTEKKLRTQLCHLLEDMAKTEKTANLNLVRLANGRLQHTAKPVCPEQKRLWKFIRTFITAYFYQREQSLLSKPHSKWNTAKWEVRVVDKCSWCSVIYNTFINRATHNLTCDKCCGIYCEHQGHMMGKCLTCDDEVCVNTQYKHHQRCNYCALWYCNGGHALGHCSEHDKYHCQSKTGCADCLTVKVD